ncbi:MAG: sodium-dependent bicarbonate transport family permease, partial [Pseudomonadota bacterium]
MDGFFALAAANLLSPAVLAFALGFGAAMARSDLSVPEAAAKAMSLYLLFAIGFKGGVGVAEAGAGGQLV